MSLQVLRIDDPRDALDRARRPELVAFARANGVDVDEQMPAILIRRILRQNNLTRISVPKRVLGQPVPRAGGHAPPPPSMDGFASGAPEIDAEADLARQFAASRPKTLADMGYNELRGEAKRRGIKLSRTDTLDVIKEKLGVKNPP